MSYELDDVGEDVNDFVFLLYSLFLKKDSVVSSDVVSEYL